MADPHKFPQSGASQARCSTLSAPEPGFGTRMQPPAAQTRAEGWIGPSLVQLDVIAACRLRSRQRGGAGQPHMHEPDPD